MIRDSKFVSLHAGQDRRAARNRATRLPFAREPIPVDFRAAFHLHYATLRETLRAFAQPGLVLLAIDARSGRLAGRACVAIQPGEARALVVGRHGRADLFLSDDEGVSLRHLLVFVEPATSWSTVRYRVLDLRSGTGFTDELGRRFAGIAADGPAMIRCGHYALIALTTSGDDQLPDAPAAAWASLPERVYAEERTAEPDRWMRRRPVAPRRVSRITSLSLVASMRDVASRELDPPIAWLDLASTRGHARLPLTDRTLSRGLLLGRDDRCDGASVLGDDNLSRCHLLLLGAGDATWAIDVSSTNGTQLVRGEERRALGLARLDLTDRLVLGDGRATVALTPIA